MSHELYCWYFRKGKKRDKWVDLNKLNRKQKKLRKNTYILDWHGFLEILVKSKLSVNKNIDIWNPPKRYLYALQPNLENANLKMKKEIKIINKKDKRTEKYQNGGMAFPYVTQRMRCSEYYLMCRRNFPQSIY